MNFCLGYDMSNHILQVDGLSVHRERDYSVVIFGDVMIDGKNNNPSLIIDCFEKFGDEIVNRIEGIYDLFIFDEKNHILHVYQDLFTGSQTLYYTKVDDFYYFSNTLGSLSDKLPFVINEKARVLFARYGYVPGKQTLVKSIYKIKPFHKLEIATEDAIEKKIAYRFDEMDEQTAANQWNEKLQRAIALSVEGYDNVSMPISGGYDSNYILHYLNKSRKEELNLYSIGGHVGKDESVCTRKIAKRYGRHHLMVAFTSNDMIHDLPDIVWRLEGATFERGIFLQYRLAKELCRNHEKYLVCGECADQVMHIDFPKDMETSRVEGCVGIENTYDFASYVIIKKSGIMLNSFGIKGIYPYTNREFMNTAVALREKNKTNKEFHKRNCERIFDKEVAGIIHKEGGATSFLSVFENEEAANRLCEYIEDTGLYKEITGQTKILPSFKQSTRKEMVQKLVFELPETIKKVKAKIEGHSLETMLPGYNKKERRIRNAVVILYLMIFEELYCSPRSKDYLKNGIKGFDMEEFLRAYSFDKEVE